MHGTNQLLLYIWKTLKRMKRFPILRHSNKLQFFQEESSMMISSYISRLCSGTNALQAVCTWGKLLLILLYNFCMVQINCYCIFEILWNEWNVCQFSGIVINYNCFEEESSMMISSYISRLCPGAKALQAVCTWGKLPYSII